MVDGLHQRQQTTELTLRKPLTGEPVEVVARQVGQYPALVLAERHLQGEQFLKLFRVGVKTWDHRISGHDLTVDTGHRTPAHLDALRRDTQRNLSRSAHDLPLRGGEARTKPGSLAGFADEGGHAPVATAAYGVLLYAAQGSECTDLDLRTLAAAIGAKQNHARGLRICTQGTVLNHNQNWAIFGLDHTEN